MSLLAFSKFLLLLLVFLFNQGGKKKSRNSLRCSFPNSVSVCLLGFGLFFSLPRTAVILADRKWNFASLGPENIYRSPDDACSGCGGCAGRQVLDRSARMMRSGITKV